MIQKFSHVFRMDEHYHQSKSKLLQSMKRENHLEEGQILGTSSE